jgi:PIN domain nuclease of toxin-antitoxin system
VNLLLDTHVFLWWDQGAEALSETVRDTIARPENSIFVSAASVWEIAIKRRRGRLDFPGSPSAAIGANGFHMLVILPEDAEQAGDLVWDHGDPFDRLLVAQAMRLDMTLVTADRSIRAFGSVTQLWGGSAARTA